MTGSSRTPSIPNKIDVQTTSVGKASMALPTPAQTLKITAHDIRCFRFLDVGSAVELHAPPGYELLALAFKGLPAALCGVPWAINNAYGRLLAANWYASVDATHAPPPRSTGLGTCYKEGGFCVFQKLETA